MKARLQLDLPRKSDTLACSAKDRARGRERIEDRERERGQRENEGGGLLRLGEMEELYFRGKKKP